MDLKADGFCRQLFFVLEIADEMDAKNTQKFHAAQNNCKYSSYMIKYDLWVTSR
jgi:hypothetical protein